jgi:hypothetical protein
MIVSSFESHRARTKQLARNLRWTDVYHWLVEHGYFPESYVLPPCFKVIRRPLRPRLFAKITRRGTFTPALVARMSCDIHFPKTDLIDRTFGVIHPEIYNDIAYHIARNWQAIVDILLPKDSAVACYSFPLPLSRVPDSPSRKASPGPDRRRL